MEYYGFLYLIINISETKKNLYHVSEEENDVQAND